MTSFDGLDWLTHAAWPLWLAHGVDWRRGAFHEHLDATLACGARFRRLRVVTRQTFVFAAAARRGVPGARDAVALGLHFLRGPARLEDGGYAWRFDLDNRVIDDTRDLYDHAFVLLALAAAAEVVGPESVIADARALEAFIATCFAHPRGGYRERLPGRAGGDETGPRRQNPHMHLFEALLAAAAAFGDERFLARAGELVRLFATRFFQAAETALPEFFDDDLRPVRNRGRFATEPGHHYEWVWLISRYQCAAAAAGAPALDLDGPAVALFKFAERHGVGAGSRAVNGVWSDGTVADAAFRLWPQTERLKAVARFAPGGFATAAAALARHLGGPHPGLWIERMDGAGAAVPEPAPATSLYHLTAAFTDDAVLAMQAAGA